MKSRRKAQRKLLYSPRTCWHASKCGNSLRNSRDPKTGSLRARSRSADSHIPTLECGGTCNALPMLQESGVWVRTHSGPRTAVGWMQYGPRLLFNKNHDCCSTKNDEAHGHPDHDEHLWGRGNG